MGNQSKVSPEQRHTSNHPCPICNGHPALNRNAGERCYGFVSNDGTFAHCTRAEFASQLTVHSGSNTYVHRLGATCNCGSDHRSFAESGLRSILKPMGQPRSSPPSGSNVFVYRLGDGTPVVRVVRTLDKRFYQQHSDGSGTWVTGTGSIKTPLYRLPELLNADPGRTVFLLEGEKDVDRAIQEGLVATTNSQGANAFEPYMVGWLAGRDLVIIADNDETGRGGARSKAVLLSSHAQSLKLIECLPGVENIKGGDLSDWFDFGHSSAELRGIAESLPEWSDTPDSTGLALTKLDDFLVQPENEIAWIVDGWMPAGGTSVVIAKPKVGKSTFARNLSLDVARGTDFLGHRTQQGPVIYIALEETKRRVREQFRSIGATGDEPIHIYVGPSPENLFEDLYVLARGIKPRLIVLDPMFRAVRVHDSSAYAEVTNALDPIIRLAANTGCHVLVPHHAGKQSRDAVDSALGSTAIAGTFDSIFVLRDKAGQRSIEVVLREGEQIAQSMLSMEPESERISLGAPVLHTAHNEIAESIVAISEEVWLTEPEITERVTGSTKQIRETLRQLYANSELLREGEGKRGSPYVYSANSFSRSATSTETTEQEIDQLEDVFELRWDSGEETNRRTERLQ
jgi:hypothetical protein